MTTLLVILEQTLLHIPLMLGAYISFSLLKVPDLSIETAYVVGAITGSSALLSVHNMPIGVVSILVVLASCIGGALVGLVSSTITQKGHLSHLLSSIITFGLFHGINQYVAPAYRSLSGVSSPLALLNYVPQYPDLCILGIVGLVTVFLLYCLFKTQLGYAYAVYGNNPLFFSNYGISSSYVFITGIVIANALAGLSGYLFAQSNTFVELNMGLGKALLCIAALILGKVMARTRSPFSIAVPLMGTVAYFTLQQLLLKIGFNLKYFTALQALVLLCILLYTYRGNPQRAQRDMLGV